MKKRLLFLAEGATMAHFVRLLALAEGVDKSSYDVYFYAPARFSRYLQNRDFVVGNLNSMPGEQFLANIAKGAPLFPQEVLRRYVGEDQAIIRQIKPDLAIGDMRLSLPISARLESTPCAVMINAYWSPFAKHHSILPEIPLSRIIPPRILAPFYKMTEPLVYALHVAHLNRVRSEFGVPKLPLDLRSLYADGDHVLYADIPGFIPTRELPAHHHYVGTCDWNPPTQKPGWWEQMRNDPRPKVFVSLGSSGPVRVLPGLIRALSRLDVSIVLSTSGRQIPELPKGIYVADLLPFKETAALVNVVVSHGGSGGMYPALAAGTPVLGIPSNADQHLSTAFLVENGAGLGVRVEEASERRLGSALGNLLHDDKYRNSAQAWKEEFSRQDSSALFQQFLSQSV